MSPRRSSREGLLDAAEAVVRGSGAAHLTLDAVCARAGISKGGLLYHFRTKEALLLAMVERLHRAYAGAIRREAAKLPPSPARELKAFIRAHGVLQQERMRGIAGALLAAGAHDPRLLKPVRVVRRAMIGKLRAPGMSAAFIELAVLVLDGMWQLELLGISAQTQQQRRAVIRELLRLVDAEEARSSSRAVTRARRGPGRA